MKEILTIVFVLFYIIGFSQQSTLRGIVSIHNSETETGKRIYVANAQVEDDFGKAQPVVTDANGRFTLVYVGVAETESVSFLVKKTDLEVVNGDDLQAVAGQQEVVKISMASKDKLAEYRRRIYQVGKTEAEKNLELLVGKKNKELALLRVNNVANITSIQKLKQELLELEYKRKKIDEQARKLAAKYLPLNLDDASADFRYAFDLFQKGYLDSALHVLSKPNQDHLVDVILNEERNIAQVKDETDRRDSILRKRKAEATERFRLKADLHKTKFEFDSATHCFELLVRLNPADMYILYDYADYLHWLNQNDKAIYYYNKALDLVNQVDNKNKGQAALILDELGSAYNSKNDFNRAEGAFMQALQLLTELTAIDSLRYEPFLAKVKSNLGVFYLSKEDYVKAEKFFTQALEIRKRLVKTDSSTEYRMVYTQGNLALVYSKKNDFNRAEAAMMEVLETFKRLAAKDPYYEADLAGYYGNLGNLYVNKKEFNKARAAFAKTLEIYQRLAATNKERYEPLVARTHNNLGIFYDKVKDSARAEAAYIKAQEIFSRLSKSDPDTYEPEWAASLQNLSSVYLHRGDFIQSKAMLVKALAIYKRLAGTYPSTYQPLLVSIYVELGIMYEKANDQLSAKKSYGQALEMATGLATAHPDAYEPTIGLIQTNLGVLCIDMGSYHEAELNLFKSFTCFEKLMNKYPKEYADKFERASGQLGLVYIRMLDSLTTYPSKIVYQRKLLELIEKTRTRIEMPEGVIKNLATGYGDLAWFELCTKQFKKAEQSAKKGLKTDAGQHWIKTKLAHALLLQDKYAEAVKIYKELMPGLDEDGKSYISICLEDFEELERTGITHKDIAAIRSILKSQPATLP